MRFLKEYCNLSALGRAMYHDDPSDMWSRFRRLADLARLLQQ